MEKRKLEKLITTVAWCKGIKKKSDDRDLKISHRLNIFPCKIPIDKSDWKIVTSLPSGKGCSDRPSPELSPKSQVGTPQVGTRRLGPATSRVRVTSYKAVPFKFGDDWHCYCSSTSLSPAPWVLLVLRQPLRDVHVTSAGHSPTSNPARGSATPYSRVAVACGVVSGCLPKVCATVKNSSLVFW